MRHIPVADTGRVAAAVSRSIGGSCGGGGDRGLLLCCSTPASAPLAIAEGEAGSAPTDGRPAGAAMAVVLVAVVAGADLSRSLAAMRLAQIDCTHLSSSSSCHDNAHNSKTPPSRNDVPLYTGLCRRPGASVSRSTTLL